MRRLTDAERLQHFMASLGHSCRGAGRVYLVGGASAVLLGWRAATVDVDLKLDPEPAGAFEAIAELKDRLDINIELAAPDPGTVHCPMRRFRALPCHGVTRPTQKESASASVTKRMKGVVCDHRCTSRAGKSSAVTVGWSSVAVSVKSLRLRSSISGWSAA